VINYPLKRNLTPRFRESRIRNLNLGDKNRYDKREMIEEMIESILYAPKVLDNSR
jgi:hypothetical protein